MLYMYKTRQRQSSHLPCVGGQQLSQLSDRLSSASVSDTDQVNGVTDAGDQCHSVTRQNKPSKAERRRVSVADHMTGWLLDGMLLLDPNTWQQSGDPVQ